MGSKIAVILLLICTLPSKVSSGQDASALQPPYGQLSVHGTQLVGSLGQPVQLKGMSLFWSIWKPQFWNAETINALKYSWNANVVRAPMGIEYPNGYLNDPTTQENLVHAVVDAAIAAGIYVIVDWHEEHAFNHQPQAVDFFARLAQKYGQYPNIIYETFNEPVNVSWSQQIKPYHEAVISAIRKYDANNIIICGTQWWDTDYDEVIKDPIRDPVNIMYTLHFYAATHHDGKLMKKAAEAISKGLPLFVTEYGTCESTGNGTIDEESMRAWWDFMDQNRISNANWALDDKFETSAALVVGTTSAQVGDDGRLTPSGRLVKTWLKKSNTGVSAGCCGHNGGSNTIPHNAIILSLTVSILMALSRAPATL